MRLLKVFNFEWNIGLFHKTCQQSFLIKAQLGICAKVFFSAHILQTGCGAGILEYCWNTSEWFFYKNGTKTVYSKLIIKHTISFITCCAIALDNFLFPYLVDKCYKIGSCKYNILNMTRNDNPEIVYHMVCVCVKHNNNMER